MAGAGGDGFPWLGLVPWGELDGVPVVTLEVECVLVGEAGDFAGCEDALALGVVVHAVAVGGVSEPLLWLCLGEGLADRVAVVFAEGEGDGFEGAGVGDAGEDQLGLEEGEEPVGLRARPSVCGLGRGPAVRS